MAGSGRYHGLKPSHGYVPTTYYDTKLGRFHYIDYNSGQAELFSKSDANAPLFDFPQKIDRIYDPGNPFGTDDNLPPSFEKGPRQYAPKPPLNPPPADFSSFRSLKQRYISKASILRYLEAPTRSIVNEYVLSSKILEGYSTGEAATGSEAHRAIEYGLRKVKEAREALARTLTKEDRAVIIRNAILSAETKLHIEGSVSKAKYVNEIIRTIGTRYLESEGKDDFYFEKQLQSSRIMDRHTIGTRLDLIYFDSSTNTVKVYDWKTGAFDQDISKLRRSMDTKIMSVVAEDNVKHLFPGKVDRDTKLDVIYGVYDRVVNTIGSVAGDHEEEGIGGAKFIGFGVSKLALAEYRMDIDAIAMDMESTRSQVEVALRNPVKGALGDVITRMVRSGKCNPDSAITCRTCPARFVCPMSKAIDAILLGDENKPESALDAKTRRAVKKATRALTGGMEKDFSPDGEYGELLHPTTYITESLYDPFSNDRTPFERVRQVFRDGGSSGTTDLENVLKDEYRHDIEKKIRGIRFRGSVAGREGKMPFDILSPKTRPSWIPRYMHNTLRNLIGEHIDDLASITGSNYSGIVAESLDRNIGRDKVFQEKIARFINSSASETLKSQGIIVTKNNINDPLIRKYISSAYTRHSDAKLEELTELVRDHVEEKYTGNLLRYDPGVVAKYLDHETLKQASGEQIRRYLQGTIKKKASDIRGNDEWVSELRKGMSVHSTIERFRLGGQRRIPMGLAASTYVVSYIAATVNAQRRQQLSVDKAIDMATTRDEVEQLQHGSATSVVMRILGSDMGSKTRTGYRVSDLVSGWAMKSEKVLRNFKDALAIGIADATSADPLSYDEFPVNSRAMEIMRSVKGWGIKAAPVIMASAAITAAVIMVGGLFTSDSEKKAEEESRYKRTVRKARLARTSQTRLAEDESETRKQTLLHTPYAFSVIPAILQAPMWRGFASAAELAGSMAKKALSKLADVAGMSDFSLASKEIAGSGRLGRTVAENAGDVSIITKTAAARASGEMGVSISSARETVKGLSRNRKLSMMAEAETERRAGDALSGRVKSVVDREVESALTMKKRRPGHPFVSVSPRDSEPNLGFVLHRSSPSVRPGPGVFRSAGGPDGSLTGKISDLTSVGSLSEKVGLSAHGYAIPRTQLAPARYPLPSVTGADLVGLASAEPELVRRGGSTPGFHFIQPSSPLQHVNPREFMENRILMGGRSAKATPSYPGFAHLSRDYR